MSAIMHFDAYLITHPFVLETDHRALLFLNSAKQGNGRLARWAMKLQPFAFSIRYKPGCQHINADSLSRLLDEEEEVPSGMPDAPITTQTFGQPEGGGGRC